MVIKVIDLATGQVCAETNAPALLPSEVKNQTKYRIEAVVANAPEGTRVFVDGNQWCAVRGDFVNLAESLAGFGDYPNTAIDDLILAEAMNAAGGAV